MTTPTNINIYLSFAGMVKRETKTVSEIKVKKDQIPEGTRKVCIVLEDIDFFNFPHGSDILEYKGTDIELVNKFSIIPLNPPVGSHRYRLTVRAHDDANRIIGSGEATEIFPV